MRFLMIYGRLKMDILIKRYGEYTKLRLFKVLKGKRTKLQKLKRENGIKLYKLKRVCGDSIERTKNV